jgi:hypothetical protein
MRGARVLALLGVLAALLVVAAPAEAASALQFRRFPANTPGSDLPTTNAKLNAEYIQVKNTSSSKTVQLRGWTLKDSQGHLYRFPTTTLRPGVTVYVHTGSGADRYGHRYMNRGYYIWNNTGDTTTLRAGTTIKDRCRFPGGTSAFNC